jgi:hypothetical protein
MRDGDVALHSSPMRQSDTGLCSTRALPSIPSWSASRTNSPMPAPAAWPSSRPPAGFNPLFLYGGVGLGKTHLMHAIAWEFDGSGAAPRSVAYMSAEKFMYRFIAAIRSQSTIEFKDESAQRRRADDRRPAIPDRQGQYAGRILPHLQCAGGCRQADRGLGRQIAVRPVRPGRPAAHPAGLRHGGRSARHHLRTAHFHPGSQGRRAGVAVPARCWNSWRTRSRPTCASWKAR